MKKFLLLTVLLFGFGCEAPAQNPTCPTRPQGDSSNACASTAFVANAVTASTGFYVNAADFGVLCNGTANDTTPLANALASLTSGGTLVIPKGSCKVCRGNGGVIADNIVTDNVTVIGSGLGATTMVGYNGACATPDDRGNEFYNIFQATSRSNVTLRNISFSGFDTPVSCFGCTNVTIQNISDNGNIGNASGFFRNKSIYLHQVLGALVSDNSFDNVNYSVYLSGDAITVTKNAVVSSNQFMQSASPGSDIINPNPFPVGVYVYYADNTSIVGNTCENIYSSKDNGDAGTGMGYCFYEGDGASNGLVIASNSIRFTAKALKTGTGIFVSSAINAVIIGNAITAETSARLLYGIRIAAHTPDVSATIKDNTIKLSGTNDFGIELAAENTGFIASADSNKLVNASIIIQLADLGNGKITAKNNSIYDAAEGFRLLGTVTTPVQGVVLSNNTVERVQNNCFIFGGFVVQTIMLNNTCTDGNLANNVGINGAGIISSGASYGLTATGNVIQNTVEGGGLLTYGIANATAPTARIYKDVFAGNVINVAAGNIGTQIDASSYWNVTSYVKPSNGIYDLSGGQIIENIFNSGSDIMGWQVTMASPLTMIANASSASTTITVSDTTSILAGDLILLMKRANAVPLDYSLPAQWHATTVASVTDGTHFVVTNAIPAGDGTYVAGTAFLKAARLSTLPAIVP